uniref:Uncharacterized protein n=1 Tax=Panagrellus redivivus TaxID=6233 RepID=A0A7E4W4R0_PANRE
MLTFAPSTSWPCPQGFCDPFEAVDSFGGSCSWPGASTSANTGFQSQSNAENGRSVQNFISSPFQQAATHQISVIDADIVISSTLAAIKILQLAENFDYRFVCSSKIV